MAVHRLLGMTDRQTVVNIWVYSSGSAPSGTSRKLWLPTHSNGILKMQT